MKNFKEQINLGIFLVILSVILYLINYSIFKDAHHIFLFLTEDLAFIPIEVLFVSLIIERLISKREKRHMLEKLNMVIGLFFTEIGTDFLKICVNGDPTIESVRSNFFIDFKWTKRDYLKTRKIVKEYSHNLDIDKIDFNQVRNLIHEKRPMIMRMLQNQALMEHDTFTELLQAVFHLDEEFCVREKMGDDFQLEPDHLARDLERVYAFLAYEYLEYMQYLENEYPYLFYSALIINPYDKRDYDIIKKSVSELYCEVLAK